MAPADSNAPKSVELEALKPHTYARRDLRAGDTYSATSEGDARVLRAMGRAKPVPTPKQVTPPELDTTERERGTYATTTLDPDDVKPRRGRRGRRGGYNTRRLKADA